MSAFCNKSHQAYFVTVKNRQKVVVFLHTFAPRENVRKINPQGVGWLCLDIVLT